MTKGRICRGRWPVVALILVLVIPSRGDISVFRNGQVLLPVLVASDAHPEERKAAEELKRLLEKMSGLPWPLRNPIEKNEPGFYIGGIASSRVAGFEMKVAADLFSPKSGEMPPDGFRIESRDGSVFIAGGDSKATGFAVGWLLQRQGGVRWYSPGATGEIVPVRSEWSLPDLNITMHPAYVSREITGLRSPEEMSWAEHNGLRVRLEFSHALNSLFPASLEKAHPDWMPLRQGERYRPVSMMDSEWQPNIGLPAVAEFAGRAAQAAFSSDAARISFSLGINDTVRFDESEVTQSLVEPLHYFRGMPDYSPLVFTFMNRAASTLTTSDRYLGCLAYFWCENPPPFPVHPAVLPYVTSDRSQYFDRTYRAEDFALMSRWGASGVRAFGLWEYAYGRGFVIPRVPHRALVESIREGWARGARGYLAEMEPNWGFDAFKAWMVTQLLWNPDRSYDELADDFFPGYYGAAARPMRQFFERSEAVWMNQSGSPRWLKYYQQQDQSVLFPKEVCAELGNLLAEAAGSIPGKSVESVRVNQTIQAFAVTIAYVDFDGARKALADIAPGNLPDGHRLSGLIGDFVRLRQKFLTLAKNAGDGTHPAMGAWRWDAFVRDDPVPRLLWLAGVRDPREPGDIVVRVGNAGEETKRWRRLAGFIRARKFRGSANLVANSAFLKTTGKSFDPGFLYPRFGPIPSQWQMRAIATESGSVAVVDDFAKAERKALRIEGARNTQVFQWRAVEPDCVYSAFARMRGHSGPGNDAALFLTFVDSNGKLLGQTEMQSLPKGTTVDWREGVVSDEPPAGARWVGIGLGATGQESGDWLEATDVELKGVLVD